MCELGRYRYSPPQGSARSGGLAGNDGALHVLGFACTHPGLFLTDRFTGSHAECAIAHTGLHSNCPCTGSHPQGGLGAKVSPVEVGLFHNQASVSKRPGLSQGSLRSRWDNGTHPSLQASEGGNPPDDAHAQWSTPFPFCPIPRDRPLALARTLTVPETKYRARNFSKPWRACSLEPPYALYSAA